MNTSWLAGAQASTGAGRLGRQDMRLQRPLQLPSTALLESAFI